MSYGLNVLYGLWFIDHILRSTVTLDSIVILIKLWGTVESVWYYSLLGVRSEFEGLLSGHNLIFSGLASSKRSPKSCKSTLSPSLNGPQFLLVYYF